MEDEDLLKEHEDIMDSFAKQYLYKIQGGYIPSIRIMDLVLNDVKNMIDSAQSPDVKKGLEKTIRILENLQKFPLNCLPEKDEDNLKDYYAHPIIQGFRSLRSLMYYGCVINGKKIVNGKFIGRNPCREYQYDAVNKMDELKLGNFKDELPDEVIHLANALDAFSEQCLVCPYRALETKE